MNVHSDEWIYQQVERHYQEALKRYDEHRIVGVFLQGSQNYGLDTELSDVDTKVVVIPSWEDICFNRRPISTTHVLDNDEHLDAKDVRLMFNMFRKQNVNFLEILFTKYKKLSPYYQDLWGVLTTDEHREQIAHYNPVAAIRTMKGMCSEKLHALEHPYPSKVDLINQYGYDPKQLHHIVRMSEYIERYKNGEPYADCLISNQDAFLRSIKLSPMPLEEARELAVRYYNRANSQYMLSQIIFRDTCDSNVDALLNDAQSKILRKYLLELWEC